MSGPTGLSWQASQVARFQSARRSARIGHAWLLSGPRGVGKRKFADWMAASLFCETPDAEGAACGRCRSCILFRAGSHPDWFVLAPEPDKRDIPIDAVRELCERLSLSAQLRRAKVACIDPADALNVNGINALLKTIEEPPPNAYLLLLSSRPQSLPATLRSRCQRLNFPIPDAAAGASWLAAIQRDATQAQRDEAMTLAFGAPLTASELIANGSLERDQVWRSTLDEVGAGRIDSLTGSARIGKPGTGAGGKYDRAEVVDFCNWLQGELQLRFRERVLSGQSAGDLDQLRQACVDSLRQLERNANTQLVLEALLIGWRSVSAQRGRAA